MQSFILSVNVQQWFFQATWCFVDKGEFPRLLLRPGEAAEALGIGRSRMYQLLGAGLIPSVRIGKTIRVPVNALREWVAAQLNAQK